VSQSGIGEGLCLVNAMHITASVFINDDESGLHHDYEVWLEKLAPHSVTFVKKLPKTGTGKIHKYILRGRSTAIAPQ